VPTAYALSHTLFWAMVGAVNSDSTDTELHFRHLHALRRGQCEVIEQLARSREAIKRSLELIRLAGKIEHEQWPFASIRDPL
jgi:hypothetical protein